MQYRRPRQTGKVCPAASTQPLHPMPRAKTIVVGCASAQVGNPSSTTGFGAHAVFHRCTLFFLTGGRQLQTSPLQCAVVSRTAIAGLHRHGTAVNGTRSPTVSTRSAHLVVMALAPAFSRRVRTAFFFCARLGSRLLQLPRPGQTLSVYEAQPFTIAPGAVTTRRATQLSRCPMTAARVAVFSKTPDCRRSSKTGSGTLSVIDPGKLRSAAG